MRSRPLLVVGLLVTAALAGCAEDTQTEGSASVYVEGDPSQEFQEVHVTVSQIHVREEDNRTANATQDRGDTKGDLSAWRAPMASEHREEGSEQAHHFEEAAGWQQVAAAEDGVEVTFGEGTEDRAFFLGESTVPATTYVEAGMLVDSAYAIDGNGSEVDITVVDRVARAEVDFETTIDQEIRLVLSLDLEESLSRGEDRGWRLAPAFADVRVTEVDDASSGEDRHEPGEPAELDG